MQTPEPKCPLCGGTHFSWGFLQGDSNIKFKRDDGWWEKNTLAGGEQVRARHCEGCGNLQLFTASK